MRKSTILAAAAVALCACRGQGSVTDPNGSSTLPDPKANNGVIDPGGTNNSAPDPFPELPCEGVACEEAVPSVTPRLVRLTHHQWENAVRDLLYLPDRPGLSASFLGDTLSTSTFDRQAEDLKVEPGLWDDYREAAEMLAAQVTNDPAALERLLGPEPPTEFDARARALVTTFGRRAYRRELTDAEVDEYLALMNEAPELFGGQQSFQRSAELALRAFLQSPHFLYRVETHDVPDAQIVPLNGWERAARLSFALWNTIPDDALLDAAANGELDDHETLATHVERMLDDPRAKDVIADFHAQLVGFEHFAEMSKAPERFPDYSDATRDAMERELELFIEDVVFSQEGTYRNLMTDSHTFVNAELAAIYGVAAPADEFGRVELDAAQRPGLLTRSGFLALNATAYDPNPIHRGVFVDRRILCLTLPQPPDNFTIPDGVEGNTNRERIHNATAECGGACHVPLVNPPGFAFENYDAVGAYRTMDNGYPVDASGQLTFDGEQQTWQTGPELVGILAGSKTAHQCYVKNWFEYLNGRAPTENDEPLIARLAQGSLEADATIKELLAAIVTSDVFLKRDSGRGQQ